MLTTERFTDNEIHEWQQRLIGGRKSRGLTQKQLADILGLSQGQVAKLELSPSKEMTIATFCALGYFFYWNLNEVARELGMMKPYPIEKDEQKETLIRKVREATPEQVALLELVLK